MEAMNGIQVELTEVDKLHIRLAEVEKNCGHYNLERTKQNRQLLLVLVSNVLTLVTAIAVKFVEIDINRVFSWFSGR